MVTPLKIHRTVAVGIASGGEHSNLNILPTPIMIGSCTGDEKLLIPKIRSLSYYNP